MSSSDDDDSKRTGWVERNRPALAAYNRRVAAHGLLSDEIDFASINSFIERHGLLAERLRYRPDSD
jgi:post-segregation antitoxin (ccd killing protein)